MKPRVALVAKRPSTSDFLAGQLRELLGRYIIFEGYATDLGLENLGNADLVLVSTLDMTGDIARHVPPGTDILVLRRTLHRGSWERVMALPAQTRAMLVNDDQTAAMETIALLHELGADHLDLVPVYPGLNPVPDLPLAITPGESQLVPLAVRKIIDIGPRMPDAGTVADILARFGLLNEETNVALRHYMAETIPRSQGLHQALSWIVDLKREMELLLDMVDEGVVAFDRNGYVTLVNRKAEEILLLEPWKAIDQPLESVVNQTGLTEVLRTGKNVYDEFRNVHGRDVVVNQAAMRNGEQIIGGVLTLKEVKEIERLEIKLRRELKARGHEAKYTFRDLVGRSRSFKEAIAKAHRMTRVNAAILILGESGTGKELFAQAIHNASPRANAPFVAVNCAALPESLLESELFGYEEGAFTGARRGGKAGLFEQAHQGTVFLDEIGEMPQNLQARMLRVLQEKEVMRIGGTRVVPVDIRVIAATNRDLADLVERGAFRADLYYRLNVLPLHIPPLRERREDIPFLVEYFLSQRGGRTPLPPEIAAQFQSYDWPGNIRELENCLEYLLVVGGDRPKIDDLPETIRRGVMRSVAATTPDPGYPEGRDFLMDLGPRPELLFILGELYRAQQLGLTRGRRALAAQARRQGLALTEQEIRTRLERLERAGLVEKRRGRAGTRLTDRGRAVYEQRQPEAGSKTG
ncbi:MAG: sigma 54-interacting transcriptional regulator [Actinobacteria bacterium]|nr:sigma 54-interacting transcriptional regulator [Actinomycetota bacterium]